MKISAAERSIRSIRHVHIDIYNISVRKLPRTGVSIPTETENEFESSTRVSIPTENKERIIKMRKEESVVQMYKAEGRHDERREPEVRA